jgi:hypothetical protein
VNLAFTLSSGSSDPFLLPPFSNIFLPSDILLSLKRDGYCSAPFSIIFPNRHSLPTLFQARNLTNITWLTCSCLPPPLHLALPLSPPPPHRTGDSIFTCQSRDNDPVFVTRSQHRPAPRAHSADAAAAAGDVLVGPRRAAGGAVVWC